MSLKKTIKKPKYTIHSKSYTPSLKILFLRCYYRYEGPFEREQEALEAPTDTDGETRRRASLDRRRKAAMTSLAFQRLQRRTVQLKMGAFHPPPPPPPNRISMSLHYIFKWRADVKAAAAATRPGDTGHILMTGKWDLKGQRLRSFHLTCATKQETKHTHKNLFCSEFTMKQDYFFSR